jgi:hypothetical protein
LIASAMILSLRLQRCGACVGLLELTVATSAKVKRVAGADAIEAAVHHDIIWKVTAPDIPDHLNDGRNSVLKCQADRADHRYLDWGLRRDRTNPKLDGSNG